MSGRVSSPDMEGWTCLERDALSPALLGERECAVDAAGLWLRAQCALAQYMAEETDAVDTLVVKGCMLAVRLSAQYAMAVMQTGRLASTTQMTSAAYRVKVALVLNQVMLGLVLSMNSETVIHEYSKCR